MLAMVTRLNLACERRDYNRIACAHVRSDGVRMTKNFEKTQGKQRDVKTVGAHWER
jgi:hypothetical protein